MDRYIHSNDGAGGKGSLWYGSVGRGVEAGIEGAINSMRLLWEQHSQEEEWVFFLINAQNVFNEENQTAMLWAVRNEWTGCA